MMTLNPKPMTKVAEGYRRSCTVTELSSDGKYSSWEMWFVYPSDVLLPEDDDADSYLLAALLPAMRNSHDIKVNGSVSSELLSNLCELQLVWHKWCPDLYHKIEIEAGQVREVDTRAPGAISAYSGGVDAMFTAYRHTNKLAGYRNQELRAGVFVHGFDIPLSDSEGFNKAAERNLLALDDLEMPLFSVKTNIREVSSLNWEHYCGLAISSVLVGFKNVAGTGLIASGESYDSVVAPWGSHPMTDHLLSSGSFKVIHDGAGYSRSEKIRVLASWPAGLKNLRVCWVGEDRGVNCGVCEKCVRTRLNFLLAGVSSPACFDGPLKPELLSSISLRSDAAKAEWCSIRDEIIKTGVGAHFLKDVEMVLSRKSSPKFGWLLPAGSRRRRLAKNIAVKFK